MPSLAYSTFSKNLLKDVDELILIHDTLKKPGKNALGHLTRSGIVMLCAAWEVYIEEVLKEASRLLIERYNTPDEMPLAAKKVICNAIKYDKDELSPLKLAGDRWKKFFCDQIDKTTSELNTPKSTKINTLFNDALGIAKLSSAWSVGEQQIDSFVKRRGEIAHNGGKAAYPTRKELTQFRDIVLKSISETDDFISEHLKKTTGKKPWNIITV